MPKATIKLMPRMSLSDIVAFARQLDYYSGHERIIIDLPKDPGFWSPFQMLFLAMKLCHFKSVCKDVNVIFNGWENYRYLSHMGFFGLCGFRHGNDVGEAMGSRNYAPISRIDRSNFYESDADRYEELPDLIQRRADAIAEIIARDTLRNKEIFDVLSFSIREVIRNVFEHGGTETVYYCAQYWDRSNKVEFSVADFGVGIRKALGQNPNFRFKTDKESLEYALLPSVSGKTHLPRTSNVWFNSGYGLYMTSRLARNGGSFTIVSGNCAINLSQKVKTNHVTSFPGTALRVNIDVGRIDSVEKMLAQFRREGQEIARTITGSGNRPPSAMSLLLRRDFQKN